MLRTDRLSRLRVLASGIVLLTLTAASDERTDVDLIERNRNLSVNA
jgi:hypothetical protein